MTLISVCPPASARAPVCSAEDAESLLERRRPRVPHLAQQHGGNRMPPCSWAATGCENGRTGKARTASLGRRRLVGALRGFSELVLELRQRLGLELAHPLAGDAELLADRLERRRLAVDAEAQLDDPTLTLG